jgi:hypothetical protein
MPGLNRLSIHGEKWHRESRHSVGSSVRRSMSSDWSIYLSGAALAGMQLQGIGARDTPIDLNSRWSSTSSQNHGTTATGPENSPTFGFQPGRRQESPPLLLPVTPVTANSNPSRLDWRASQDGPTEAKRASRRSLLGPLPEPGPPPDALLPALPATRTLSAEFSPPLASGSHPQQQQNQYPFLSGPSAGGTRTPAGSSSARTSRTSFVSRVSRSIRSRASQISSRSSRRSAPYLPYPFAGSGDGNWPPPLPFETSSAPGTPSTGRFRRTVAKYERELPLKDLIKRAMLVSALLEHPPSSNEQPSSPPHDWPTWLDLPSPRSPFAGKGRSYSPASSRSRRSTLKSKKRTTPRESIISRWSAVITGGRGGLGGVSTDAVEHYSHDGIGGAGVWLAIEDERREEEKDKGDEKVVTEKTLPSLPSAARPRKRRCAVALAVIFLVIAGLALGLGLGLGHSMTTAQAGSASTTGGSSCTSCPEGAQMVM